MKKEYTISIVGGGSRYTPGILRMLVNEKDRFPLKKVTLYDNEPNRQEKVGKYGEILFREYYPECEIIWTTDPQTAFEGIDFAFMQIRAGRLKMREQDEKIAIRNGCIGQETCGPGGFAYGMRSVPAVVDLVKEIRKYSSEAWILNYSNPAAIVAEATNRIFKDDFRIINICDMPISIIGFYSIVLGKRPDELEARYFGLNHFGWFTKILDKKTGEDYLPRIRELFKTPSSQLSETLHMDQSWTETVNFMSTMISDYDDFLPNTYLQYYLYPNQMLKKEDPNYTRANEVMDGHERKTFEELDKIIARGALSENDQVAKKGVVDGHASYIVDLANAIANNTGEVFLCITENTGIISNLTNGMMVEVPCRIGSSGLEPLNVGEIPTFHKGLLENQYAYEKLTVDACLDGSYKKAWNALTLNRCVNDTQLAKVLLDDYIIANKDYWPELK